MDRAAWREGLEVEGGGKEDRLWGGEEGLTGNSKMVRSGDK